MASMNSIRDTFFEECEELLEALAEGLQLMEADEHDGETVNAVFRAVHSIKGTEDPTLSRMTLVTIGSDEVIEQITKQLNKLIEVVKIIDLTEGDHIERELMFVKVKAIGDGRDEIKRLTDIFRGSIIDVTDKSYTIELTGTSSK